MKISIVTINFNHRDGLERTIESVVNQTFTDYEWLIIDGGSTDGSKELIEKYQDHLAYWCSEPDKGVYNAMNKGIRKAKGDYLVFMNSGDIFANNNVLQLVADNLKPDTDILYGYMMRKTTDGEPNNIPMMKHHLYWEDFYFDTLPHQSSYIRRSLFDAVGLYNERYKLIADWVWFAKAFVQHHVNISFIASKLSIYECGGISEDDRWKDELSLLQDEIYPSCNERELDNLRIFHRIREYKILSKILTLLDLISNSCKMRKQYKEFDKIRHS